MRKIICAGLLLLTILLLPGCGENASEVKAYDFSKIYPAMTEINDMPDMLLLPADKAELLYGIDPDICIQEFLAICQDSLRADEIWLIEAVDNNSAGRIEEYAKMHIDQKSKELKNYLPDQYNVMQKAKLIRNGNYVILLISPAVDELMALL